MDEWEIVGEEVLTENKYIESEEDESSKEDESKADTILESPIVIPEISNTITNQVIVPLAKKYIKNSIINILTSDKFWMNVSIMTMKHYGDLDWRINCVCLTVNASILVFKYRKYIKI